MKFLTSKNNSMGFFAFVVWGLAKVNESERQQCLLGAYNHDFKVKNKKSAVGVNKLN